MKYYVEFGDEDREERDFFPYASQMFDSYKRADDWRKMLPTCMEWEIIGYDESTDSYSVEAICD